MNSTCESGPQEDWRRLYTMAPREMFLGDIIDWGDSRPHTWPIHARRYMEKLQEVKTQQSDVLRWFTWKVSDMEAVEEGAWSLCLDRHTALRLLAAIEEILKYG